MTTKISTTQTVENLKLTAKEIKFLQVFLPDQDIYDSSSECMDAEEISMASGFSVNIVKGIMSSLQKKSVIDMHENYVIVGKWRNDDNAEDIFKKLLNKIGA